MISSAFVAGINMLTLHQLAASLLVWDGLWVMRRMRGCPVRSMDVGHRMIKSRLTRVQGHMNPVAGRIVYQDCR
jgi:bisphosphoglycerate-independent phosphoglycerate mutase (AlkP superfamily)